MFFFMAIIFIRIFYQDYHLFLLFWESIFQNLLNVKQYVNDIVRNGGSYRYYGDADDKQKFIKSLKRVDASHMADFELDSSYGNHLASIVALAKAAAEAAAEAAAKASADAAVDAKAVIERNEKRLNQATHDVPTKFRKY